MTTYCTQADLLLAIREQELVQLTNDIAGDEIDTDLLARAIDRAGNEIDAVAGARYSLPFDPVPGFIRDLAVDLTLVSLGERRQDSPGWLDSKRKRVERVLDQLAAGTVTVGSQPEPAVNAQRKATGSLVDRTFTTDTLAGF